jgi:hypothetical protein
VIWHPILDDTITVTGNISGTNLQDSAYTRTITTPLVYSMCPEPPHDLIFTGVITDTEGKETMYTLTYTAHGCTTILTATNSKGKTIIIDRKVNRNFHKWWLLP